MQTDLLEKTHGLYDRKISLKNMKITPWGDFPMLSDKTWWKVVRRRAQKPNQHIQTLSRRFTRELEVDEFSIFGFWVYW